MIIRWHHDVLKVSHVDHAEITNLAKSLVQIQGDVKVTQEKCPQLLDARGGSVVHNALCNKIDL